MLLLLFYLSISVFQPAVDTHVLPHQR